MSKLFTSFNKLRLLVFVRFLGESLYFPFVSLYLSSVGFETHQIGIVIASSSITALVCAPIYSAICKTPRQAKIALMVMSVLEPLCIVLLILSKSFILSLCSIILVSIFSSTNYGLLDSLMALTAKQEKQEFSKIRVFGSSSYLLGVLLSSYIIKYLGYRVLFSMAISLFVLTLLLYFTIKAPNKEETIKEKSSFKEIFKNKSFLLYVIFYVLLIGSMQVSDDFFSLYLKEEGGKDHYYSYVMVGFIVIEILTMSLFKYWFKHLGYKAYFVSAFVLVIRLFIQMLDVSNLGVLMASQMLRGITWGIALSLNSRFIVELLGFSKSTRGIIFTTFMVSVFTAIFKYAGGYIIEDIGYPNFYKIFFVVALACFIYFIFFYKMYKKKTVTDSTL